MSQLPPDPLAHIDDAQLSQESIQAIANFATYVLVPKQFGIISGVNICGKVLLFHVALCLSRENGIQQAYRYLSSITLEETGVRPISCVFTYLAKVASIMGHANFGPSFNTHGNIYILGVEYHWAARKRGLSLKACEKLRTLRRIVKTSMLTVCQLATILGVKRYAAAFIGKKLFSYHAVFSWARRLSTIVQIRPETWDEKVFLPYRSEIGTIMAELLASRPVPVYKPPPLARPITLITDASKTGYGGVRLSQTGEIKCSAGNFNREFPSSVQAEPEGMVKAALDLLPREATDVFILLDHQPLVYAANSNAPKEFSYNWALGALAEARPTTRFYFAFVPGVRNVADGLSRGKTEVDEELASLVAGTGWSSALQPLRCRKCGLERITIP